MTERDDSERKSIHKFKRQAIADAHASLNTGPAAKAAIRWLEREAKQQAETISLLRKALDLISVAFPEPTEGLPRKWQPLGDAIYAARAIIEDTK